MSHNSIIGLAQLIQKVKLDLLAPKDIGEPDLFTVDEIVLEINFTVSGDIDSGFNLGVVTLGSKINEERIQKVTVKLTPIVSKEQLIEKINQNPEKSQMIVKESAETLVRGDIEIVRG